jgi:hypothetical protein
LYGKIENIRKGEVAFLECADKSESDAHSKKDTAPPPTGRGAWWDYLASAKRTHWGAADYVRATWFQTSAHYARHM